MLPVLATQPVNTLHAHVETIVRSSEVRQQIARTGMIPVSSPAPEELQSFSNSEIVRWGAVVRHAGIAGSEQPDGGRLQGLVNS
jgi:tripartite-type tricarboxylate transporter receptor subunit TctC